MITDLNTDESAAVLQSIRALAAKWRAEKQQAIAGEMFDAVVTDIESLADDELLIRLGKETCVAIVELVLTMMEHAIPADRAEPPVVAMEYARLMADRGLPLEDLLRTYRLGHACLSRMLADEIMLELARVPVEQVRGVRETERFLFVWVDVVSSKISAAYIDQRQRFDSRTVTTRHGMVRALLDGYNVDIARAEKSLGHSLTGPQLAFICWGDGDTGALQRAVNAMQKVLNAPRPVVVPADDGALCGWFELSRATRVRIEMLAEVAGTAAPAAHVALGPIMAGLNGFCRSRAGAERVRRMVGLSRKQPPTLTEWTKIAFVDALSADLDAARELVRIELGALSRAGEHFDLLRHTAHAYVVSGFSYAAVANSMHVHRNTALYRIKKAVALRGKPLTEQPAELLAALALMDAIGPALLEI